MPPLSLHKVAHKPTGQPLLGAAGIDVVAGRKDLPAQDSDPDLNFPRETEQKGVEAVFFVSMTVSILSIQFPIWTIEKTLEVGTTDFIFAWDAGPSLWTILQPLLG